MPTIADFPKLRREWHPTKNGDLRPNQVTAGCHRKVWWKCAQGDDHEWLANCTLRVNENTGCPFCANLRVCRTNSLAALFPHLAREWHPTKNGLVKPAEIVPGTNRKFWWKCPKAPDHEWEATCSSRTSQATGCPFCRNLKVCRSNCLATLEPELAREWHPTKNGKLTPFDVVPGAARKVWWRCTHGHEYLKQLYARSRVGGCPFCTHQRVMPETSLAGTKPELAAQWHASKNGMLRPEDFFPGSKQSVWWQCPEEESHVWQAKIFNRVRRPSCPFCAKRLVMSGGRARRARRFIGVRACEHGYVASIDVAGTHHHCGVWSTQRASALARDRAALYLGSGAQLNFPRLQVIPTAPAALAREAQLIKKRSGHTSSRYLGVWQDDDGRYRAFVSVDGRVVHLGIFPNERAAAEARDRAALFHGASAERLNFPERNLTPASPDEVHSKARPIRSKSNKEAEGLIGVQRLKAGSDRWMATLSREGVSYFLGIWDSVEAAALAYDRASLHHSGDSPSWKLNFPEEARRLGPLDAETLAAAARAVYKENTTSRFRGVWWATAERGWKARLNFAGRIYDLGTQDSEEDAARAYDRVALEILGDRAKLNFHPVTGEELCGRRIADAGEEPKDSKPRAPAARARLTP